MGISQGTSPEVQQRGSGLLPPFQVSAEGAGWTDLDSWAITAWSIWNARNKFYFEHTQLHPRVIMERAATLLSEYQMLTAAQQV